MILTQRARAVNRRLPRRAAFRFYKKLFRTAARGRRNYANSFRTSFLPHYSNGTDFRAGCKRMAGQCKHLRKALHIFGLLRNRGEVHPARGADMPLHRPAPGRDMRNEMGRYFIRGQVAQGAAHGAEDKGCGRRAGRAENPACIRFAQERALQPGSAGSGLTAGDGGVVPLRRRDLHTDRGGGQVSRPADVSKQVLRHAAARRGAQGQLPHAEAHLCHKLRGYGLRPQDPLRDTGSLRCEHHTQHICSPLRSS